LIVIGMHVLGSPQFDTEPIAQDDLALVEQSSCPLVVAQGTWQLPAGSVPASALQGTPGPMVPGATSVLDVHVKDASTRPSFGTAE
jgi:hypothetical protein